jgi:hypothetical protein
MYEQNKRKALSKHVRQQVYEKCGHHCAYCGAELQLSKMQVDHAYPFSLGGLDEMENYLPACRSCNNYKHSLTIDGFRKAVERWCFVLQRDNVTYRNAVRFGMVIPNEGRCVFYFEKLGISAICNGSDAYDFFNQRKSNSQSLGI